MRFLFVILLLWGCDRSKESDTPPVNEEVTETEVNKDQAAYISRLDIEQRPYYSSYDVSVNALIVPGDKVCTTPFSCKVAYAVSENQEPINCEQGEFSGMDFPPVTVSNVKPNARYFIKACPIQTLDGVYGDAFVKEFSTGALKD